MRKVLITLLLFTICCHSYAQEYFNKRLPVHSIFSVFTSVIPFGNKYYVTGNNADSIYLNTNEYAQGIKFSVFDEQGNLIRDTFYRKDSIYIGNYRNNARITSEGNFLIPVSAFGNFQSYTLLVCMDTLGRVLWEKTYPKPICTDNDAYQTYDLKPTGTGEWLMVSHNYCNYTFGTPNSRGDILLTKLDSAFNVIWNKTYGVWYWNDWPGDIVIQPDGYLITGNENNYFGQQSGFYSRAELIKVDTAGNELWTWRSAPDKLISKAQTVIRTQDGGYVYCGQGDGVEEINQWTFDGKVLFRNWIEKLDSNRNVVWNKVLAPLLVEYSDDPLVMMKELPDGSIVVAGSLFGGYELQDSLNGSFASLVKLSANGDIIWKRLYKYQEQNVYYTIHDMQQTPDGGFVMVGEATDYNNLYGNPIQQGWILKVDSNGCEQNGGLCNPTKVATAKPKNKELKIYPNPANDVLYIEGGETAIEYRLVNITGSTMRSGKLNMGRSSVDIKDLAPGMYILHAGGGVYKVVKE